MSIKPKDIILVAAAMGLVAAAVIPSGSPESAPDGDTEDQPTVQNQTSSEVSPTVVMGRATGCAKPLTDIVHLYWPLKKGSSWMYRVDSPDDLVTASTWSISVESGPNPNEEIEMKSGFDEVMKPCHAWIEGRTMRTDCLPFVEPLVFRGNIPNDVGGALLPSPTAMIEGATWNNVFNRNVTYRSKDRHGKSYEEEADGLQTDRSLIKRTEDIVVPAGRFDAALRIDWTGRIELKANKRTVLLEVTSAPFREDKTWFVKGIGMVRRTVAFQGEQAGKISFDLIRYDRPQSGEKIY